MDIDLSCALADENGTVAHMLYFLLLSGCKLNCFGLVASSKYLVLLRRKVFRAHKPLSVEHQHVPYNCSFGMDSNDENIDFQSVGYQSNEYFMRKVTGEASKQRSKLT